MKFKTGHAGHTNDIEKLFLNTFTASEGEEEGRIVSQLTSRLMQSDQQQDILCCTAWDAETLLGCIFFSRLRFPKDSRSVFILAPVAVATAQQGRGTGQALIRFGLDEIKAQDCDVALTYGDPAYYGKVGFRAITTDEVAPPLPLQYPEGWLGQSLSNAELEPLIGPSQCVEAFNDPSLW
ncbi:GNAT family N-acetyltransferase [uncultured Aliiroseovarius sp.]|uniref:GNAT family N-acetyltransferase n=1 Tax=uncultured Aliiroseovarius sp. TaxID=1658783 RepID=UPI00262397D1|nr:N-acetyltransferase [uncultured Aliiroseovarius sp.]